ncbi:MAG: SIS domain-containing protein, partial [Planctomycetota bacterium]
MCGIIAVLRRASARPAPTAASLRAAMAAAETALAGAVDVGKLDLAAQALGGLDAALRGVPGLTALLADRALADELAARAQALAGWLATFEAAIDGDAAAAADAAVEDHNRALVRLKDALWAVRRDRLPHAAGVRALAGDAAPHAAAAASWSSLQLALDALDRLEVRGRDSAGLSILVTGVDPDAPELRPLRTARADDPLFQDGSVRAEDGCLAFVYKHAAEIGELGDNVKALRASIAADRLLQAALRAPRAEALVLGHTRWASVGIISEANAHPLTHEELDGRAGPLVLGALNGDVDNHHDLVRSEGLRLHEAITTDAKVIPVLVSRRMRDGLPLADAFRRTVATFTGSVAIAAVSTREPHRLALALRGSGQALYVGCAEDTYVVASEPYGVVEECGRYLRLDGETPGNPQNPAASRGQVVVLDRARAGEVAGLARASYDGTPLPVADTQLATASVTTRDIDRGTFRHFLHKEIGEAPQSLRKTLRGRIVAHGERLRAALPDASLPAAVRDALAAGAIARVLVIGQGTAAVAGQAVAGFVADARAGATVAVAARPAPELSGVQLRDDMRDTLVVAVSQSGTTTDTIRTVDLVRARGARVLGIVNRLGIELNVMAVGVIF